jgi:hypothetical protein
MELGNVKEMLKRRQKRRHKTVQDMKDAGYDVKVRHYRAEDSDKYGHPHYTHKYTGQLVPCNALTVVTLSRPYGDVWSGKAYCGPQYQFCRKMGVRIALGRALKQAGLPTTLPREK